MSGRVSEDPADPAPIAIGPFQDDAETIFGFVAFSLEMASPGFGAGRAARLFTHVDVAYSFDSEDNIVNQGAPGPVGVSNIRGQPDYSTTLSALNGRGSATEVAAEPLVVSAGLGLSFEFESWGRSLRVKSSIEWLWQEISVAGKLGYAESNLASGGILAGPACNTNATPPGCPNVYLQAGHTQGFHSIGPGLEFEMDASRAGPFMLSVYVAAQAYRLLGDREVEAFGQGELSDESKDVELFSGYEMDPWHYRTGVGLRFRWMPE